MVQIIVVISSVLLGLLLYPLLAKSYTRFITSQYKSLTKDSTGKQEKNLSQKVENPSLIGKSKFSLSQSTPKNATNFRTEKPNEKEHIFVAETVEEPNQMDIHVLLEETEKTEAEINYEEEEINIHLGKDAVYAGGASFDELMQIKSVIEKPIPSVKEELEAGKILYQNQETHMVEQLASGNQAILSKVSSLIKLHLEQYEKEQRENVSETDNAEDEDEFKGFDFASIL